MPDHDLFSFLTGRPYVAHEWLSAVVFSLLHAARGSERPDRLQVLVRGATVRCTDLTARRLGGRLAVFLPVLAVVLYIGGERFIERPHLFTFLLTAAVLYLVVAFRVGR